MKILFLHNKPPYPPKDGSALATFNMAMGLADLGHEVHILCMNTHKHYLDISKIPENISKKINITPVDIDTKIRIIPFLKNLLFSSRAYNLERFIQKKFENELISILKKIDFDIIQMEGLYAAPYLEIVKKTSKAKTVNRSHNMEFEIWERKAKNTHNLLKKLYYQIISKRLKNEEIFWFNKFNGFIAISHRDLNKAIELGLKNPSVVIPVGVPQKNNTIDYSNKNFFYLGSMDWEPNQEAMNWFLKEVWPEFHNKYPEWLFFLAGRNMPQSFKNIKLEGYINCGEIEDLSLFLSDKNVLVSPLFSAGGIRVKLVESMMEGRCIIASDIAAEGILIENGINILIANDKNEFIKQMEVVINNPNQIEKIGRAAQKSAQGQFDLNILSNQLIHFYKSL